MQDSYTNSMQEFPDIPVFQEYGTSKHYKNKNVCYKINGQNPKICIRSHYLKNISVFWFFLIIPLSLTLLTKFPAGNAISGFQWYSRNSMMCTAPVYAVHIYLMTKLLHTIFHEEKLAFKCNARSCTPEMYIS